MADLFNLARMSTVTEGTGAIILLNAVPGFLEFVDSGVSNGETVSYGIVDGANSEVGRGVYTASGTTLTRSVIKSTNSDAEIELTGNAEVYITLLAEDYNLAILEDGTNPFAADISHANFAIEDVGSILWDINNGAA